MYETFVNILNDYQVLIIPVLVMIISQGIKLVIDAFAHKKIDVTDPIRYGGMPSSHAAAVSSASVMVALIVGVTEPLFFLTILFSLLVIRDALGLRMELTKHAIAINKLTKRLPETESKEYLQQCERVGHTFWQVSAGVIIGIVLAFLFWWIITLF